MLPSRGQLGFNLKALPGGRPSLRELCLRSLSQFYQVMAGGFYPPICKSTRRFGGRVGGWLIHWLVAWTASSHYLKQCWIIVNWTLRNKRQWKFSRNSNFFIQENALEHVVCETAAILSRPQCVIPLCPMMPVGWCESHGDESGCGTSLWAVCPDVSL